MLVLLGVSTALAVITPDPREPEPQEETTPTGPTGATGSSGDDGPDEPDPIDPNLAIRTVKPVEGKQAVPKVKAEVSGRLVLTVETGGPAVVEIPAFGRTEPATEYAPAVFDLVMPDETRTFKVFDAESGDPLAEVETIG